jgi:cardiolipin synthase
VTAWEPRYTRSDLTLANAFTIARIVLVPFFGRAWLRGEGERALWLFGVAVATDLVDGFLARWLNQRSRLGALLDPIADKFLVFVSLIVGTAVGAIPLWLAVLIVARDAVLAVGAILFATRWKDRHGPAAWRPTRIGKYAMALQSATIALVIVASTLDLPDLRDYARSAMVLTAILTVTAGVQYTIRAARALERRPPRSSHVESQ